MRRFRSLPRFVLIGLFSLFAVVSFQPRVFSTAASRPLSDAPRVPRGVEPSREHGSSVSRPAPFRPQTRPQWATPVPISNADPDNPPDNPDVAVCPDGTVHVVWEQGGRIWHNYRTPHGGWSGPQPIVAQDPLVPPQELKGHTPAIAATPDCRAYLAWSQDWGPTSDVFFAWWDGTTWWGSKNVSQSSVQSLHPDIAVTSSGEPRIVWAEGGGLNPTLYSGKPINGEWSRVFIDDFQGDFPTLVFDVSNRGHLAWQQWIKQQADVYYTQQARPAEPGESDSWPSWSQPISNNPTVSSLPRIAIVNGKPVIVWIEKVEGNQRLVYGSRATGSEAPWGWTKPEELSAGQNVKAGNPPAIAVGQIGPAHLAWAEKNPVDAIAYTMLWPSDGGLLSRSGSPPEVITNGGQNHRKPAIATSADGAQVYLVWLEDDGNGTSRVYFSESEGRVFYFYIPLMAR